MLCFAFWILTSGPTAQTLDVLIDWILGRPIQTQTLEASDARGPTSTPRTLTGSVGRMFAFRCAPRGSCAPISLMTITSACGSECFIELYPHCSASGCSSVFFNASPSVSAISTPAADVSGPPLLPSDLSRTGRVADSPTADGCFLLVTGKG
uniref:(northern house mosquito) hypothetical protein n=1 Tax=Culex pipiens TaxID=7175 RepID=A0A8D8FXH5_CULPI